MNFLSNYKYKFLFNRFYKNKMSVRKYNLKRSIKKVGIIFENDYYFDESFIVELIENLSIKRKNIYLMNFGKNFFEFDNSFRFEKGDSSFLGKISGNLKLFLEADFDLLINYFNSNSYEINLFSLKCKKKISAGFINTDRRVNDIIFNFSPSKKKLFIKEISKYIKIEK